MLEARVSHESFGSNKVAEDGSISNSQGAMDIMMDLSKIKCGSWMLPVSLRSWSRRNWRATLTCFARERRWAAG